MSSDYVRFFPAPLPDELLYGIIACYAEVTSCTDPFIISSELFGKPWLQDSLIPVDLMGLEHRLHPDTGITAEKLLLEHTLYPYYCVSELRQEALMHHMLFKRFNYNYSIIYHRKYHSRRFRPGHLRLCPSCVEEDRRKHGRPYWHRSHQLFGVDYCIKHREPLHEAHLESIASRTFSYSTPANCIHRCKPIDKNPSRQQMQLILELCSTNLWLLENGMNLSLPRVNEMYEKIIRIIPASLFQHIEDHEGKPHLSIRDIIFEKFRVIAEHIYLDENDFDKSLDLFFGALVNTSLPPYGHAMLMMTFSDLLQKYSNTKLSNYLDSYQTI
jgi:hypothetical protein